MEFKEDISKRIKSDFNDRSDKANKVLKDALSKIDYLNNDRIVRCIIFLANGDLNSLKKHIETAIYDTRDVMLWAEYTNIDKVKPKRVRDFNKTFEKCTEDVRE